MTQKSHARQQRDAVAREMAANPTAGYDDLQQIFEGCREALIVSNAEVVNLFKEKALLLSVPSPDEVAVALRSLGQDIAQFGAELNKINETHKGKTGKATTPDENADVIQIFELYYNYQQRYNGTILPTVMFLAEQAGSANTKLIELATAQGLIDPAVISDVEVKPVGTEAPVADPASTAINTDAV